MSDPKAAVGCASVRDAKNPLKPCTLKCPRIQLIPLRYGLVEKAPSFPAIKSGLQKHVHFRPLGARVLATTGYIYVIHSERPDIVYAFRASPDGSVIKLEQKELKEGVMGPEFVYDESEPGLFVERAGSIEVLYSQTPISPKLQGQLLTSAPMRKQLMQRCHLGRYDLAGSTPHLIPPDRLGECLADCHPSLTDLSEHDKDMQWCWQAEPLEKQTVCALRSKIHGGYRDDAAFLVLEDPIGIMTELASAFMGIDYLVHQWLEQGNNRAKHFAAEQLTLLIEVGESQLRRATDDDKLKAFINQEPDLVKRHYEDYIEAKEQYDDLKSMMSLRSGTTEHTLSSTFEYQRYSQARENNKSLSRRIGIKQKYLEDFFLRVKDNNENLRYGESMGAQGVQEVIRFEEMTAWYKNALERRQRWSDARVQVEHDLTAMRPYAYRAIPIFDKENKDALLERLKLENHWLAVAFETKENYDALAEFFFSKLGEQSLQLYTVLDEDDSLKVHEEKEDKKEGVLKEYEGKENDTNNFLDVIGGWDATNAGNSGLDQFRAVLNGVHLEPIAELSDEVKAQYNLFGSQLSSLALQELDSLARELNKAQTRYSNLLRHARPGLVAILLGQARNANVVLNISNVDSHDALNKAFDQLENIRLQAEQAISNRNRVEREMKGATQVQKDAERAMYNRQLQSLGREAEAIRAELATSTEPIVGKGKLQPPSKMTIVAEGASEQALDELRNLRRRVMRNEILWGTDEGKRFDGAVKSGSLSFIFFLASTVNWHSTANGLSSKHSWTIGQKGEYLEALLDMIAASTSVATEVMRAKTMLDHVRIASDTSGNLMGKAVTLGNFGVGFFTFFSSVAGAIKQTGRIEQSWRKGDWGALSGTGIALVGDGMQMGVSGRLAGETFVRTLAVMRGALTWAEAAQLTLGLAARLSPLGWIATGLIFGGELIYNYFQYKPLVLWARRCAWGEDTLFEDNPNWDYQTQLVRWQEVRQAPQLQVETRVTLERQLHNKDTYRRAIEVHHLQTLRLVVPMAAPPQIRLAGVVKYKKGVIDITSLLMTGSRVTFDGMNTLYEFDWPQAPEKTGPLRVLDLLVEVISQQKQVLFAEQSGARFSLNLQTVDKLDSIEGRENWYTLEQIEFEQEQLKTPNEMKRMLRPLQQKQGESVSSEVMG